MILGAGNRPLAHRARRGGSQPRSAAALQRRAAATADGTLVEVADPAMMIRLTDHVALEPVATDARARLSRVVASLGS